MFKSRKIGIDAVGSRNTERRPLNVRSSGGTEERKLRVNTMSDYERARPRSIPDDYKTLERARGRGWGFILFLLVLFAATVAGFYFWNDRPTTLTGDSVELTVEAERELVSGDEIVYLIQYKNRDTIAMRSIALDVQWPDGFYFNESSEPPTTDTATTWDLGPMNSGETRQLRIKGQLVGNKGQTQTTVFRLTYRPENISSDYQVASTVDVYIIDSQIDVAMTAPEKVIAGQEVEFAAEVSSLTGETLSKITVEITPPKDFEILSQEPKLAENKWTGDIPSEPSTTFKIRAKVADDADGEQAWVVEITTAAGDQMRKLLRKELAVTPVRPDFGMELKINGQSTDFDIGYGETLNYQLKLTNKSSSALKDLKVTALIDSDVVDRKSIQSTGVTDKDSITWTKEHVEQLAQLEPNGEALISWKAQLLPQGTIGRASVDTLITVEIEGLPNWRQTSPVFVVSVGEGLVFNQGIYWNLGGEKVGSGNLPPVTNERTQYLAVWSLDSGSQDFDSVTVSSFLPAKVTFVSTEEVDEGALKYDEETNRLEWQINNFSSKLLPLKASFYLKLVPRDEDKGSIMAVLNPATVVASGNDVFQSKSFGVTTSQVVTTEEGDVGTVIE